MSDPRIDPASIVHAGVLAELHRQCFPAGWTAHQLQLFLGTPAGFGALAVIDQESAPLPVGFILCQAAADSADIVTLGVVPAERRRGHAGRLLDYAMAQCRDRGVAEMFLEVAEDNAAAIAFYRRWHFAEIGRRAGYYRMPEGRRDALVLARRLEPITV